MTIKLHQSQALSPLPYPSVAHPIASCVCVGDWGLEHQMPVRFSLILISHQIGASIGLVAFEGGEMRFPRDPNFPPSRTPQTRVLAPAPKNPSSNKGCRSL